MSSFEDEQKVLTEFVAGRLSTEMLREALETQPMQSLLQKFEDSRYPAKSNHWRRLNDGQDLKTLGGLVNAEGIIEDFLKKLGVPFTSSRRYRDMYALILSSLPAYVDPPLEFLVSHVLPSESNLSKAEVQRHIKSRIKSLFVSTGAHPKWIQSAEWPIEDGVPFVFLGQIPLDAPEFFHDSGAAYLFLQPSTGKTDVVMQFH